MELFPNEAKKLETLVDGWLTHPKRELEATFGAGGQVDQTRFMAVVQRLKAKGYVEEEPKDYMTITIKDEKSAINVRRDTLKSNTRFTIEGSDDIRRYCAQESLENIRYDVILKTAIGSPGEDDLVLEDYEMKFKVRREEERDKDESIIAEILSTWPTQKKAFRLIRRWTFKGDDCVFDLSMIRSNKRNESGSYIFSETFSDPKQNILAQPPTYEVEVELKHTPGIAKETAMKKLIKAVGEVLRGLQRNSVLIRKSLKKQAFDSYKLLVESDKFRGVKPRTLEMKNFVAKKIPNTPNIREGYNVTDKADGLRVLGYCDGKGELFMIDKALNVYRTGLQNEACKNSLVDGEWITTVKDETNPSIQRSTSQLLLFDIYIAADKKVVDSLPFYSFETPDKTRFSHLTEWVLNWNKGGPATIVGGVTAKNRLIVMAKIFEFAKRNDIFELSARVLRRPTNYNTDGLIFTSNSAPLPGADANFREQFKWKPAEDNTIDFLVRVEKDAKTGEDAIHTETRDDTGVTVDYKTLILKVGSTTNPACANPRDTILFEKEYPKGGCRSDRFYRDSGGKYRAVQFNPSDYPDSMASICRVEVIRDPDTGVQYISTERSNEPIEDRSIVEMRYDMKRAEGWKWVPIRVRVDKTEKLQRGELSGSLNADFTADSVWASIHNPITRGMISTGNDAPLQSELEKPDEGLVDVKKGYFQRKANKEQLRSVEGLRNFHKHGIKGDTLLKPVLKAGKQILLDLAVGEAADINRWISNNVAFVYGMDIDAKGILDSHRGAYMKYLNRISENAGLPDSQQIQIPTMIFGIGDVSKSLTNGSAGETTEEQDILRSVFGKVAPQNVVPPFVENQGKDKLKGGADVISCMFALHYFFKSKETFNGLLENINANLKQGGYFVACFFDGKKVFELLKSKKPGESVSGTDRNTLVWRIKKEYDVGALPTDDTGFGLPILNEFISIGAAHREYLVPFELFQDKMKEIGCELVKPADFKDLGLTSSSQTFDETYKTLTKAAKAKGQELYPMSQAVSQFSFLNRWCIFKRYGPTNQDEEEADTVAVVEEKAVPLTQRANSVAWKDVPADGNAGPTSVLPPPATKKTAKAKTAKNELPVPLTQTGGPAAAPVAGPAKNLASAMVKGVTVALDPTDTLFESGKVFPFGPDEVATKILTDESGKVIYSDAAARLAPFYPFEIIDAEDPKKPVTYPSILHYLAAMEYKKATDKPELAASIFGVNGTIHQKMILAMLALVGTPEEIEKKKLDLWKKEAEEVLEENPQRKAQKWSLTYRPEDWVAIRDSLWKKAYETRFQKDQKMRDILTKLRGLEKVLLYRTSKPHLTNLGLNGELKGKGRGKATKYRIEGENKLGKILMQIAEFPGFKIESALEEETD